MFTVHRFTTKREHHARRGTPALPIGSTLYAISYGPGKGFFTWAYVHKDAAQRIAAKLYNDPTHDQDFNRVQEPDNALHTFLE